MLVRCKDFSGVPLLFRILSKNLTNPRNPSKIPSLTLMKAKGGYIPSYYAVCCKSFFWSKVYDELLRFGQ